MRTIVTILTATAILLGMGSHSHCDEPAGESVEKPSLPTVAEARRQAALLHDAMHAALQVVHHRFYREDEGLPLPAAVFQEIFADVEKEQNVKLRWLAVDGVAMNADHKPRDAFERDAFQALKSGQRAFDQATGGVYRRAGAIALTNHCLKCHVPDRKTTDTRTAGLIITLPVRAD
ncbi:MAG: DUF3365 domain-containing protein [Planctomycetaceae bacterium]|nr:DUF3365 domain-containing protein [Planctomycetaceae bacterium]